LIGFLSALRTDEEYKQLWKDFKVSFNRQYKNQENQRFELFKNNVDTIDKLNQKFNPRTTFGINQFADWSYDEYRGFVSNGFIKPILSNVPVQSADPSAAIPTSVDWRAEGAVTPVMDQGQCGSSPFIGAVASIEGAWKIAGNPLVVLSVQQVLDCSTGFPPNQGCDGGLMNTSFEYVLKAGGIQNNLTYPYTAWDGTCSFDITKSVAKITSYVNLDGTEDAFTQALVKGPVATAVNCQPQSFVYYQSGIYDDPECSPAVDQINHGIVVVGYGVQDNVNYYILKNSWTSAWGIQGYMLLARNGKNTCGIATYGTYPVI